MTETARISLDTGSFCHLDGGNGEGELPPLTPFSGSTVLVIR
jgi:hypothetical protein